MYVKIDKCVCSGMVHCQEITGIFCLSPVLRRDLFSNLEAVEIDGKYDSKTLDYRVDICDIKNVCEYFQCMIISSHSPPYQCLLISLRMYVTRFSLVVRRLGC